MRFYTVTTQYLRDLETKWRAVINRFCGPIPSGLGISHMATLTNGNEDPVIKDSRTRPLGIMAIPWRMGQKYGYKENDLKKPVNNIYVWAIKTNKDAITLHRDYPTIWTVANYDFWISVHLCFLMNYGFISYS